MNKILFIDDDERYQKTVKTLLELEGFKVDAISDPIEAVELFKKSDYDIVLSDLVMNTIDGLQLVSLLRRIKSYVPIIILTGHEDSSKEIEGFNLEVDDYIYKTTLFEVLVKRIKRCIRVKSVDKYSTELRSDRENLLIDLASRKVIQKGEPVQLTFRELELLAFLLRNKNVVLSREEILQSVWHIDEDIVDARTIDTHIKNIREKLKITSISTIRGVGYEWFE